MPATEARAMTRGRRQAPTAAGRRAQVRRPLRAAGRDALQAHALPRAPRSSVRARQRAPGARSGGGAGSPGRAARSWSCPAGGWLRSVGRTLGQGIRVRGVGNSAKPDFGGCISGIWRGAFAAAGKARMPSPLTRPSPPAPPSGVQPGGGCSRGASGAALRALVLRPPGRGEDT